MLYMYSKEYKLEMLKYLLFMLLGFFFSLYFLNYNKAYLSSTSAEQALSSEQCVFAMSALRIDLGA